ncbi:beta-glucosidase 5 [Phyllosticta capitalensis]
MKSALLAVAAGALLGNTAASAHNQHQSFHQRRQPGQLELREANDECVCSTYVTTVTGTPQLVTQTQVVTATPSVAVTPSAEAPSSAPVASSSVPDNVPTPFVTTYATPGTYTIPARTVTVTGSTTVPVATTQTLTSGVNTYGGVTTSVVTETTVTCPYATVETSGSTTTSVIRTTSYYCPGNGVYTVVPPTTTSVTEPTTTDYPKVTSYTPGTYTQPERTVTITKTNDVYTCPVEGTETTVTPGVPSASSAVGGASALPSSSAPVVTSATPTPALTGSAEGSVGTPAGTPSASTPAAASSSASSGNGMTTNGNQWAITYTPYSSDGSCKSADDVKTDIADIKDKGFTTVRLYATDCDGLVNVGAACSESSLKMIIGIYIKSDGISSQDTQDQVTEIKNWAKEGSNWDMVDMVVVGNEAVFNGWATAQELGSFISTVKSTFISAGLASKAFTTTETVNVAQSEAYGSYICPVIDVVGVNVQPFFDGNTAAEDAGDFVVSQLGLASKACSSKDVFNLESGWPHQSSSNNDKAIAGTSEQATAIKSIIEKAGTHSVIFSYGDDTWKDGGEWGVEGYFGCADQIELDISGELKIGGLTISASISSEGIDVDVDLDF